MKRIFVSGLVAFLFCFFSSASAVYSQVGFLSYPFFDLGTINVPSSWAPLPLPFQPPENMTMVIVGIQTEDIRENKNVTLTKEILPDGQNLYDTNNYENTKQLNISFFKKIFPSFRLLSCRNMKILNCDGMYMYGEVNIDGNDLKLESYSFQIEKNSIGVSFSSHSTTYGKNSFTFRQIVDSIQLNKATKTALPGEGSLSSDTSQSSAASSTIATSSNARPWRGTSIPKIGSISAPTDWTPDKSPGSVFVMKKLKDDGLTAITLTVSAAGDEKIDFSKQAVLQRSRQLKESDKDILSYKPVVISKQDAVVMTRNKSYNNIPGKEVVYIVPCKDGNYFFTFVCSDSDYEANILLFERMMGSVRLTK